MTHHFRSTFGLNVKPIRSVTPPEFDDPPNSTLTQMSVSSFFHSGYEELRDYGAKWLRFWWFDSQASDSVWPAEEKDVLGHPFGACAPNASHCFGRLPEHLRQDSTLLLAIDGKGNLQILELRFTILLVGALKL